jgi:hypothetical protein
VRGWARDIAPTATPARWGEGPTVGELRVAGELPEVMGLAGMVILPVEVQLIERTRSGVATARLSIGR